MNEAFIIDGGVNYDLLVWPMERRADRKVLARVMSYEYLWHHIREVGGAYGTGMLTQDGVEYLYTYRDPHLTESYDTFAKGPADLATRDYTEKDMNESENRGVLFLGGDKIRVRLEKDEVLDLSQPNELPQDIETLILTLRGKYSYLYTE